jgi:hypothetical protein
MEALRSYETSFLHDPQSVTFQKTEFFIVTAVKPSDLMGIILFPGIISVLNITITIRTSDIEEAALNTRP